MAGSRISWKALAVGDRLIWTTADFDGKVSVPCIVSEIFDTHAIALSHGNEIRLWIDKDTAGEFTREVSA